MGKNVPYEIHSWVRLGYRCYFTITERDYLARLVIRDYISNKGIGLRQRKFIERLLEKLEELHPDEP